VALAVTRGAANGLDLLAPPSPNVAPPGWYMLFLLTDDGVPSVARWVHVEGGTKPPDPPPHPLPSFGPSTRISILTRSARLRGREVVLRVANGNRFDVPASATLRLRKQLTSARLTPAARTNRLLPADDSARLVLRLGNKKAKQIRRHGHLGGRLSLVVTDPSGHDRKVSHAVRVWAPRRP
jgi:hypothetical protein